MSANGNVDCATARDFGRKWRRFDQEDTPRDEIRSLYEEYSAIFPWSSLPPEARGFDAGCGSRR